MKKSKLFYFLFALLILTFSWGAIAKLNPVNQPSNVDYVFIQTAKSGKISYDDSTATYTLTLYAVDPWVTYMSSSTKNRVTGFMDMNSFIQTWQAEAGKKPDREMLNSAIVAMQSGDEKMLHLAVVLKQPSYDSQNNTITYYISDLPGPKRNAIPKDVTFKHVALFVDDVCIGCVGRRF